MLGDAVGRAVEPGGHVAPVVGLRDRALAVVGAWREDAQSRADEYLAGFDDTAVAGGGSGLDDEDETAGSGAGRG